MQLSEDDPTAFRRRATMLCLAGDHLLLGLALGAFVRLGNYSGGPSLPLALFVGLAFAQSSLLGIWAGLGGGAWWLRLVGLAVASSCLAVGVCICVNELEWAGFFLFTFTAVVLMVVLAIFRCFRFRICFPASEFDARTELQFGIRHLLILTVVVAVTFAVGRHVRLSLSDIQMLPRVVIIASAPFLVGVLSPWAMFGERLLVIRGVILLVIAAGAGWGLDRMLGIGSAFWVVISLAEAVLLMASLFVVRLCGYRLMRRRKVQVGQETIEVGKSLCPRHQSQESQ